MKQEGSLTYLQPGSPEPDKSSPYLPILFS